jgi:hypothetical protein
VVRRLFRRLESPTRVNSPSDVGFDDRDATSGNLTFTTQLLSLSFTTNNSVLNGINKSPNQFTGGEGPATGQDLPADHYFFVPQVEVTGGEFMWLWAPRPIVAPGTPFPPGNTDLQSWMRNENLAPDWLRISTDITGQGPFNAVFTLSGETVPEPSTWTMLAGALGVLALGRKYLINR